MNRNILVAWPALALGLACAAPSGPILREPQATGPVVAASSEAPEAAPSSAEPVTVAPPASSSVPSSGGGRPLPPGFDIDAATAERLLGSVCRVVRDSWQRLGCAGCTLPLGPGEAGEQPTKMLPVLRVKRGSFTQPKARQLMFHLDSCSPMEAGPSAEPGVGPLEEQSFLLTEDEGDELRVLEHRAQVGSSCQLARSASGVSVAVCERQRPVGSSKPAGGVIENSVVVWSWLGGHARMTRLIRLVSSLFAGCHDRKRSEDASVLSTLSIGARPEGLSDQITVSITWGVMSTTSPGYRERCRANPDYDGDFSLHEDDMKETGSDSVRFVDDGGGFVPTAETEPARRRLEAKLRR